MVPDQTRRRPSCIPDLGVGSRLFGSEFSEVAVKDTAVGFHELLHLVVFESGDRVVVISSNIQPREHRGADGVLLALEVYQEASFASVISQVRLLFDH